MVLDCVMPKRSRKLKNKGCKSPRPRLPFSDTSIVVYSQFTSEMMY